MKRILLLIFSAIVMQANAQELAPHVDITKYQGSWYVIALKPTFVDGDWLNTIESYYWNEKKKVYDVVTTYTKKPGGKVKTIKQELLPVEGSNNASWIAKVWLFVRADYSIHKVADDYSWVVVGHPKRKYLYIMSRKPVMDEKLYNELLNYSISLGYKKEDIKKQLQEAR